MDKRHAAALLKTYDALANIPASKRGRVWCTICGSYMDIDGGAAINGGGWPKHCGFTMTIDSPEERAAQQARPDKAVRDE